MKKKDGTKLIRRKYRKNMNHYMIKKYKFWKNIKFENDINKYTVTS